MRIFFVSVLLALAAGGCSFSLGFGSGATPPAPSSTSTVIGYGSGETAALARKAAWDDAMGRIQKLNFPKPPNITVEHEDGCEVKPGVFDARVQLQVTR